jgi:hypothetical protein
MTPYEDAIKDAIVAERGTGLSPHPSKEAGVILEGVNKRLKEANLDSVKVDVVYRRLRKFRAL